MVANENVSARANVDPQAEGFTAYAVAFETLQDGGERISGAVRGICSRDPKGEDGAALFVPSGSVFLRPLKHIQETTFTIPRKLLIPADRFKEQKPFVEAREFHWIKREAYDALFDAIPEEDRMALKGQAKYTLYPRGSIWISLPPRAAPEAVAPTRSRMPLQELAEPGKDDADSQRMTQHTPPDLKENYSTTNAPITVDTDTKYMVQEVRQVRTPPRHSEPCET